jgi:hypothetical protein
LLVPLLYRQSPLDRMHKPNAARSVPVASLLAALTVVAAAAAAAVASTALAATTAVTS